MTVSATCSIGEASRRPTVPDTYEYDAFGNSFTVSGTTPNNYLYRGEQFDPDLGLYYLRARYYNPLAGSFISRDPLNGNRRNPKSLHKYIYASGNPVNRIDPSGRGDLAEYRPLLILAALTLTTFEVIQLHNQHVFDNIAHLLGGLPLFRSGSGGSGGSGGGGQSGGGTGGGGGPGEGTGPIAGPTPPPPALPPGCSGSPQACAPQGNKISNWQQAENWLNETYGGQKQVRLQTPYGDRIIDNLTTDGIAQEVKFGSQALDSDTMMQIEKDLELTETPSSGVKGLQWYFFENAAGDGPSLNLVNYLINNGIQVFVNGAQII